LSPSSGTLSSASPGNLLVLPVAPGYKVNQCLIVESGGEGDWPESLLARYRRVVMPPPYCISVSTNGIYSDAVMAQCGACKPLEPDSSQDWTKFTTDEPTPIAAPRPARAHRRQLPAQIPSSGPPLVAIQKAPGAGPDDLTQVLGKPDVFRDATRSPGDACITKTHRGNTASVQCRTSYYSFRNDSEALRLWHSDLAALSI